jgi:26S proteasome regulatory subunit N12
MSAAEKELKSALDTLHTIYAQKSTQDPSVLLSRCKHSLLALSALLPSPTTPAAHLAMARETLELGALFAIRARDTEQFTRYFQQLQPFYALPGQRLPREGGKRSMVTGLFLLLLLSQGDYLSFHMLLEALEMAAEGGRGELAEDDFIQYPVRLERALMEGSYDRVWGETKGESIPGEEFEVFSEACVRRR